MLVELTNKKKQKNNLYCYSKTSAIIKKLT